MCSVLCNLIKAYTIYAGSDIISNIILHPNHKLDFGFLNKYLGREVDSKWWNTRLEHNACLAVPLAFTDVFLAKWLTKKVGPMSWTKTPAAQLFHLFTFAIGGIMIYAGYETICNPTIKDKKGFLEEWFLAGYSGCATQQWLPYTEHKLSNVLSKPVGGYLTLLGLCALDFVFIKAFGFREYCDNGLSDHEKKINGLLEKKQQ